MCVREHGRQGTWHGSSLIQQRTSHRPGSPLCGHAAAGNGRPTAKRLEARVNDVSLLVDANLELHHIPTRGGADQAGAHALVALVEAAHVAGLLVVVHYLQ